MRWELLCGWLVVALCACSSGTAGGGGGGAGGGTFGGGASCKAACDHEAQAGCGTPDCEQTCTEYRTQFAQQYPACVSANDSYIGCLTSAPFDCTGGVPSVCSAKLEAVSDCITCGPATGVPQPGNPCAAADEGKEICWGCKAILDCRYGDSVFLWRVKEDCSAIDQQCQRYDSASAPYCDYADI